METAEVGQRLSPIERVGNGKRTLIIIMGTAQVPHIARPAVHALQNRGDVRARSPRRTLWTGTQGSQFDMSHSKRAVAMIPSILLAIAVVQARGDEGAILAQTGRSQIM